MCQQQDGRKARKIRPRSGRNLAIGATFPSPCCRKTFPMKKDTCFPMLAIGACALFAAGCNSHSEQRDLMMEEAIAAPIERPVAMRGEGSFLAGKLSATATVRRGFERVDPKGESGPPRTGGPRKKEEDVSGSFAHVYFGGVSEEEEK